MRRMQTPGEIGAGDDTQRAVAEVNPEPVERCTCELASLQRSALVK